MFRPARVLPSNAPPLGDADNGLSSKVLQEHSGNRQLHDYTYANPSDQKYPASLLTENVYSGHQIPQPQHIYRQTPLQRHHYRHGHAMGSDDRARVQKAARILYHRFRNSEAYMKYRGRQHKDDKGNQGEQKWPDRLELAFFEALVRWPPMGRRKMLHKDKQRGRNELIADYIEAETGEGRTRKQVSSHIQVLKPFVQEDPFIMRMLSKEDLCGPGGQMWQRGGRMASSYHHDTRRMSTHPAMVQHAPSGPATVPIDAGRIQRSKELLEVFEPAEFQMFVQQKFNDDNVNRLHTYTQSISSPRREDEQLPDWQSLQRYPLLAAIHNVRPLDCNVLLAEASLAFPTRHFKGEDGRSLPGVELGISFLCNSRHLPVNAHVVCITNFYRNGSHLKDHSGGAQVQLTESAERGTVETQLKFGSNFWAKTLATLAGSVNTAATATEEPRQKVQEQIDSITASQEVSVKTDTGPERLLAIYWKFRLSKGERGRAYWSRLLLPPTSTSATEESYPNPDPHPDIKPGPYRNDSVYDYSMTYTDPTPYASASAPQPALQSPFEYDCPSGSGSALTSATWPSMDDTNTAPQRAIDGPFPENAFDFDGENMHIPLSYDPTLDFSQFDPGAFDFKGLGAIAGTGTDPGLGDFDPNSQDFTQSTTVVSQDYTQPDYSQSTGVSASQDYSQSSYSHPATTAVTAAGDFSQSQSSSYPQDFTQHWSAFDSQLPTAGTSAYASDSQDPGVDVFDTYGGHYDHSYNVSVGPEGQAYGGAGQDAGAREEGEGVGFSVVEGVGDESSG